jgi:hypothetical protein
LEGACTPNPAPDDTGPSSADLGFTKSVSIFHADFDEKRLAPIHARTTAILSTSHNVEV